MWSALVAEHRRSQRCRVLLVDETSMRKRHRYVTVIQNGDTGQVLAMVEHRNAAALSGFFIEQGPRWCRGVQVVVSDGSKSYKAAIDAHLGHARHVLDRFHVVRWFAAGAHPGAPRPPTPPTGRDQTGIRPRRVPSPLRSATPSRPPQRTRPGPPRPALRHPPKAASRLGSPPRTPRPLPRRRPRWRPRSSRPGSPTSTPPANLASSITSSTPSLPGATRSWPGHSAGRPSNGRIEGTNNLLQVLRRVAHGFTNPNNFAGPRTPRDMITPPKPADSHPTDSRRAGISRFDSCPPPPFYRASISATIRQSPTSISFLDRRMVAIVFVDIASSTSRLVQMTDRAWCRVLDSLDEALEQVVSRLGGAISNRIGERLPDGYPHPGRTAQVR